MTNSNRFSRFANHFVPTQIVFIDAGVEDLQLLVNGVIPGIETVVLNSDRNGIEQITEVLNQKPYSTVHIVSHGSPGCLYLGNSQLSLDTLNKHHQELATWFSSSSFIPYPLCEAVSFRASLLIYGCNVAAGDAGAEFITKLRNITGAEIAASTTKIGNTAKGGNWELDIKTNSNKYDLAFTSQAKRNYAGIFTTYDDNNASGTIAPGASVSRTFTVTDSTTINDVYLGLNATHNWRGDVEVILTSPNGTSVTLIAADANDSFDNFDLLLVDGSPNSFRTQQNEAVIAPNFERDLIAAPSNPLAAFAGESSLGEWTLTLNNTNASGGNRELTYNSSSLQINEAPPQDPNPDHLPWERNVNNNGILVRGTSFISCGTIAGSPADMVIAVERINIRGDGSPIIPASGEETVTNAVMWAHEDWTQEKLGNIYGLAIDGQGNMFATASANYGSGVGFTGVPQSINYGSIGRDAGGELGAAGTIYKMDAVTGAPAVFAQLPQQETEIINVDSEEDFAPDVTRQTGPGLGNIYHDKVNDQFFVSNFEDGRIYRLDSDGNILDSYDPGNLDDGSAGAPPVSELVYGLTVSPDGSKLFYGLDKTVFSVDLNGDGSLPGTVNNSSNIAGSTWDNYTGATETAHSTIPNIDPNIYVPTADIIVSDLEFLPNGELLVGGRVYARDTIFTSYNHGGSVYTLSENGGTFSDLTEIQGYSTVTTDTGNDDGYGGVAYAQNLDGSFDYVVSSADIFDENGPHGIAVFPDDYTIEPVINSAANTPDGNEIVPRAALGYDGVNFDAKGVGGDVDVFNPGVIRGNVSQDTTGDSNGDTNLANVTLSLLDSDGNAVRVIDPATGNLVDLTTTTDADGNYEFTNLLAGTYTVVETQPNGLFNVSENEGGDDNDHPDDGIANSIQATVVLGEFDTGNDFVETATPPTYKLSGTVFNDADGDDAFSAGDTPLNGVTVEIFADDGNGNPTGSAIASATTDESGFYEFTDLANGEYVVVQTQPRDFNSVTDFDGGTDNQIAVTINGADVTGRDFLEEPPTDYGDAPDDGGLNGNYSTTEANNGASHIIVDGLSIGSTVDADDGTKQNATATADDEDLATADKLDLNTNKLNYEYFDLTFGKNSVDDIPEPGSGIKGTLDPNLNLITQANQNDVNNYGIRYTGHIKIETPGTYTFYTTSDDGSTLSIDNTLVVDNDGLQSASTASGTYDFADPGYYPIEVEYFEATAKVGLTLEYESSDAAISRQNIPGSILAAIGDDEDGIASLPILQTDDSSYTVSVEVNNDTDSTASLVGWIDFDGDGNFAADEAATSPVNINADPQAVDLTWNNIPEDINSGDTYVRLRLSSDPNLTVNTPDDSMTDIDDGEVEDYQLNIALPTYSLSGTVFEDTEEDDVFGAGDTPIEGVSINLYSDSDGDGVADTDGNGNLLSPIADTTTDADGNYEFTNLANGDYVVIETQPIGYTSVTDIDNIDDNKISVTVDNGDNTGNNFLDEIPDDYGDAPDTLAGAAPAPDRDTPPDYLTTFAEDGPRHAIAPDSPITIGTEVDSDDGTQQNATATEDDTDTDGNDEDGVFLEGTTNSLNSADLEIAAGGNYSVDIVVNDGVVTPPPTGVAATVSGTVYNDYDNDGTQETDNAASEVGLAGITVTAYNNAGGLVATSTTDASGAYTLDNPLGEPLRVEFTDLPEGFSTSAVSGGDANAVETVFFTDGASQTANLGLIEENRYVDSSVSPTLIVPCYVYTPVATGDEAAIVTVLHSEAGFVEDVTEKTTIATIDQVGAVYGLAQNKETQDIFVGAFQKRLSDVGPEGNDAIYRIKSDGTVEPFINLDDFFGADSAGAYSHDPNNFASDAPAFDAVGKVAFGDVEISEDRQHIWTINLADRKLYKLEVGDGSTHTAGDGRERVAYDILGDDSTTPTNGGIPLGDLGADATNNARPFGLGMKDGLVYVGLVNSAQSTGEVDDLQAYVYSFDPEDPSGGFNQVINFPLNYQREFKDTNSQTSAQWAPWVTNYEDFELNELETQPILSDITFDNNGDMMIGFRDRTGDQAGFLSDDTDPNNGNQAVQAQTSGDILRASLTGNNQWTIENSVTDTDTDNSTNPEFYDDDFATTSAQGGRILFNGNYGLFNGGHDESAQGSIVQIPGYSSVESTAMDPFNTALSGGILGFDNTTGAKTRGIELYVSNFDFNSPDPNFAKANGLGDLEYAGDVAPIEIGNRVWEDLDRDGIQDAGEAGIEGVTVSLYSADGSTLLATTTTDAKGEYYFNQDNVNQNGAAGLEPDTDYQILLDNAADFADGGALNALDLTVQDANSNGNDTTDSDAIDDDGTPTISVTTGDYGENDYSHDVGFKKDITLVGWIDFNRDGIFSDNEAVTLDTDGGLITDGVTPNTLEFTAPADVKSGLTAARFRVASGLTGDNLSATTPNGAAPNGEVEDYVVNLITPTYKLSGTVYEDTNAPDDDAIETEDTPIAGVTVELFNADGNGNAIGSAIATQTTDANGEYEFSDLVDGDYVVVQTQPNGFNSVTDADGGVDNTIAATINGADVVGQDFLEEVPVFKLSGTVLSDTQAPNADEIDNPGDTPIAGVTVELFADDGNGNAIGSAIDTATTDANGFYEFTDLANGDYIVIETQPNGFDSVTDADGNEQDKILTTINGADVVGQDFLEEVPAFKLSGTVLEDTQAPNADEIDNPGDTPIEGVTVELFADDGDGNPDGSAIASTTTNQDGFYEFTDLANGDYVVLETQPVGFESVTDADGTDDNTIAATIAGADSIENDFLEETPPVLYNLSGTVYEDTNAPDDDAIETEDTPIAGVTVELFADDGTGNPDGNAIDTATTDANGEYEFSDLVDGDYVVVQTQPNGFDSVTDADGTDDNTIAATIAGADSIENDFLEETPPVLYNLSGTVYEDTNAPNDDAIETEDTPIAGVTVELFNADGNGNAIGSAIANATTNDAGLYEFTDLANGDYVVLETQPIGYESVTDADGTDDNTIAATIAGADSIENDFLEETPPVLYNLSGTVYEDTNAPDDDAIETEDTPIAGVTVELFADDGTGNPDGNAIATTTTDANGFYEFTDLANGDYVVIETQPNGFDSVTDADGGEQDKILTTIADADSVNNDFLEEVPPVLYALSGTVYEDTNAPDDDAIETEDTPIASVTVELFNADGNGNRIGSAIATTTTNDAGLYEFTDLANGDYVVIETQPVGFESVTDADGTDDNQIAATIAGADSIENDFLEETPPVLYNLSGTVLSDTQAPDADGIDNPGDTPIEGVTVELFADDGTGNPDGNAIATQTTNQDGFYEFTDLANGDYVVLETQPVGFESVTDADGTDDNTIAATIAGADSIENDFLEETPPVLYNLSGTVYEDTNAPDDDAIETEDTPIAGVTVELFNADADGNAIGSAIATQTTNDAGLYEFTDLANGDYVVVQTQPNSFDSVTDADGGEQDKILATINGADVVGQDFLEEVPAFKLSGTVLEDTQAPNADEIDNPGDTPIEGVTVEIFANDGNGNPDGNAIDTATTDANGEYEFSDLVDGDYVVVQTQPNGFDSVTDADGTDDNQIAAIINGADLTGQDFLEEVPPVLYALSGTVYEDTNAPDDDAIETEDTPIAGVTVELFNADADGNAIGSAIANATTDANGEYEFADLNNGDYVVVQTQPNGFNSVTDADGGVDNTIAATIAGADSIENDFLEETPPVLYNLSGTVLSDTQAPNADEIDNPGDTPIEGVTVEIFANDGNGNPDGNAIDTATTDANGEYEFSDLVDGDYVVVQTQPNGFDSVTDADGTDDNQIAAIINGADLTGQDFLEEVPPVLYALSGTVYEDTNAPDDDAIETEDTPIAGVTVELFNADADGNAIGSAIANATTDANGEYEFADLNNGDYVVVQTQPNGFNSVTDADGGVDNTIAATIAGADSIENDFLEETPPVLYNLSGTVLSDTQAPNADEIDNPGDTPIEGVTVELFADDGDGNPDGNAIDTATTDANGEYEFSDLVDGDYVVIETQPNGFDSVTDADGGEQDKILTTIADADSVNNDFLEEVPPVLYALSGTVYEDTNAPDDDAIETEDTPITGVTVELFNADGNGNAIGSAIATQTTNQDGFYEFSDLANGDYVVIETQPVGFESVTDADGGVDNTIAATIAGADSIENDFLEETPPVLYNLSGTVYEDTQAPNADGIDNPGDTPIEGVTVELFADDGTGNPDGNAIATQTTNQDGFYEFTDLANGDYVVIETQPVGFESVTDADGTDDNTIAATIAGADSIENDFLEETPPVLYNLSGTVLSDTQAPNADEIDNPGDTPIEGVTVEIFANDGNGNPDGNAIDTATTDANGEYEFSDLVDGDYVVVQTQPNGFDSVTDADGTDDNTIAATIAGADSIENDFLEETPPVLYNLSGTVYEDTNAPNDDAIETEDTPIAGVTVELFNADGNGNAIGSAIANATTNDAGLYEFTDLANGDYVVLETQPIGYESVTDADGTDDNTIAATIAGADSIENDFLEETPPVLYNLSGTVYEDTNAPDDDAIETEDTPIAGVTVELFADDGTGNPDGNAIATTTTDANGFYEFTDLANGDYVVIETQPNGFDSVTDADGGEQDKILTTIADADSVNNDFLEEVPPVLYALSGTVYEDTNAPDDDAIETEDTPIASVTVELFNADGNGNRIGSAIATTTTNDAGLYEFTDLANGDYVVIETQPVGFESVTDADGTDDNQIAATIAGADSIENDFLEETPPVLYNLSGTVLSDTQAPDADGIDNPGDTPIEGVTVELFADDGTGNPDGNAIATQTTNQDGFYEFTDLANGDYVVLETQPVGFESVTDADGTDDNTIAATIAGADSIENDFLEETPPVLYNLSGTVYEDTNAPDDDAIETEDTPIAGVTVELFNADADGNAIGSAIATQTTNDAGLYEFTDLANGDYVVVQTQPNSFDSVTDADGGEQDKILATINGADVVGQDFLEEVPAFKLSGTVLEDTQAPNADEIDNPGDTPIEGVTVEIFANDGNGNPDGNAIDTATTDANGEYEFSDLVDGDYVVVQTQPNGFDSVTDADGTDDNQIAAIINGADLTGQDFLEEVPPVLYALSGTVYEDTNAPDDDAIETEDTPIAGVTVELFNADADGNAIGSAIANATTDANGEYEFADLNNGDYVVVQTQPNGFNSVTDADGGVDNTIAATIAGADSIENDFLEETPPVLYNLSGTVLSDTQAPNADEIDNPGDTPIEGVTVELFADDGDGNPDGNAIDTATTDANGEYEFSDLVDGDYVVIETQPNGFDSVTDADGGEQDKILTTIADADSVNNDFLEEVPPVLYALSGTVYEDTNAPDDDAIETEDTPITGVTVELFNADGNGNAIGSAIATQTTNQDGFYEFSDLANGDYVVIETQPVGFESVTDADGGVDNTIAATIAGADSIENDFLEETPPVLYNLSGTVYEDTQAPNADGIDNPGDTPIEGVTVELFADDGTGNPDGNAIATQTTNQDGFYEFTDLANGDYVVIETQPVGFESVTDADGTDDNTIAATIAGADSIENDFLEETPPVLYNLSGTVLSDTQAPNADEIDNPGDTPIEGVTVEIFANDGNGNPDGNAIDTATTDANGEYEFSDLVDGDYVVVQTQPNGFDSVTDADGTDDNTIAATIAGADSIENDFLEETPPVLYNLSGTVYEDTNAPNDDAIETEDTPIAGVTVELFNADGNGNAIGSAIANATTNDAGLYEFTDLANGDYVVLETQPIGYESVTDADGTDDNTIAATIAGADSIENDFLEETPPVLYNLSGTVYEDTNAPDDDAIETEDTPIAGVTVELFADDGTGNPDGNAIATTTTDANGFYEFTDLANGDYVVIETQPNGFDSVTDADGGEQDKILTTIADADSVNNDFLEEVPPVLYALSGTVYEDTNAPDDDAIETEDTPIAGVTVELFNADGNGNRIGSAIATTTTNDAGLYEFTDLANGDYVVIETQPVGFESVTDADGTDDNQIAATIAGADSIENDFLEETPPVLYNLSGTVLSDTQAPDADGIDNPGDTPIEGVTVEIFANDGNGNPDGNAIANATTDANGEYEFADLNNGDYVVVQTQPNGFNSVTDADGGVDNTIAATINGADSVENDFLEETPPVLYNLSGTVLEDTQAPNADEIDNPGDTPIEGVTVEIFANDGNGNPDGSAIATTTTNDAGLYEFTDLANGDYVVIETQPVGFESVTDADGTDDNTIAATIAGADSIENDFLEETPPVLYNLSGTVLSDTQAPDADGIDNPGDTPIEGVTVELFANDGNGNPDGNAIDTATTDANGEYEFSDLVDGDYVVVQTQPNGFDSVTDADGTDDNQIAAIINGADLTGQDFLEEVPPVLYALSGTVYEDTNAPDDDAIETEDTPITGVTVELFNADGNGNPDGNAIATTTTNDAGLYEFTDLANGDYVVIETQPVGFESVTDADGGVDNTIAATINGADSIENDFLEETPPVLYNLSGTVYEDTNAPDDDAIETEDTPIAGVTVELFNADGNGNQTGSAIATQTTNQDGFYEFSDLANGDYVVIETQPNGFNSVTDADGGEQDKILTTIADADSVNNDFLEEVPPVLYALSGTVYEDTNAPDDDAIETEDTPIAGVTVELFNADGNGNAIGSAIATTTTDTNGFYEFTDLNNGDYVVLETQPVGFESVTDADGGVDNTIAATIAGANSIENDFLEETPPVLYNLSGTVYEDTNAPDDDAIETEDTPIAGVTVELFNADGNGNPEGSAIATQTTNSEGFYEFTDLANGDYVVVETQPVGFESVTDADGTDDNQIAATIAGANSIENDFLEETPPVLYNLSGTVYEDTNAPDDDAIETEDTPIAGVTVELFNADGNGNAIGSAIANVTTDANGFYEFTGLTDGDYVVLETQPVGFESVTDADGTDDNQIAATIAGANSIENDFLEETPPVLYNLSGTVYEDTNAPDDDAIETEDTPIAGVTVELFNADGNGNAIGSAIANVTTDANGFYEFTGLTDGDYVVLETQPVGFESVTDADGTDDNQIAATIAGANSIENDFLEETPPVLYNLSGTVYEDTDAPDADTISNGDATIAGVEVQLFNADGNGDRIGSAIAVKTTNDNGFYEFAGLTDGDYVVLETQPAGYDSVLDVDGANDNKIAATIDGADSVENDFLEETPPVLYNLSGTVYEDTNAPDEDAISEGDTTIADVTVQLFNADDFGNTMGSAIGSTVTDDNGFYQFGNLANGDYVVVETQPVGYESVTDADGTDDNKIASSIEGADSIENDFLEETPTELYELSGRVFADTEQDGNFSDGDATIPSVTLELLNANGSGEAIGEAIAITTTDENGFYRFDGLANGNYIVVERQPQGFGSVTDIDGFDDNRISVTIDNANVPNNNFLEVNLIEGTASPDVLIGTSVGETISGYKGQDTLTGGAGNDEFIYTETSDGVDIITDFTTGEDRIDLSQIMSEELGYSGLDPIADGLVVIEKYGSAGTMIQIDFDDNGELLPKDVVFLDGVTDIDTNTDFIF